MAGKLARLFAWYEEAGGLRATEETDSDRREEEEEEEGGWHCLS